MRYYLGLDGGGTKTAAVILDEAREELGRGQGGPCNIATCDDATLTASVRDATGEALRAANLPPETRFAGVCAGVAGYTAKQRRSDFARLLVSLVPADRHRVEPDFVIAWWGATEGEPGIVVIAGTGAVVYGRNAQGETCRVDGRGFLLGDKGSGFWIGRMALIQTMRRLDHGEPLDEFHHRLLEHIGAADSDDLVSWVYHDFHPARIAELARVIGTWADAGDKRARTYILGAAIALDYMAYETRKRLKMPFFRTPVYRIGGLWSISAQLNRFFEKLYNDPTRRKKRRKVSLDRYVSKHDAAYGAALLAMQEEA
jgi:glucosamine kinase